jgi:hypothetical protein
MSLLLADLYVVGGNNAQGVVMLWWRNLGAGGESHVLKIKRLAPVDRRKSGTVHYHVARGGYKVAVVLPRAGHPETFVRCEERPLHFVHRGRNLAPPPSA